MDFTQREYTYKYFTFLDVISAIGGVNAFISPIVKNLAPLFMLYFMYRLAVIIKGKYLEEYRQELKEFVKYASDQLNLIIKTSKSSS